MRIFDDTHDDGCPTVATREGMYVGDTTLTLALTSDCAPNPNPNPKP